MRTASLAWAVMTALAATPLRAQDKPANPPAAADQPADKPAEKPPEKKNPPVTAGPDGFSIQSETGDYRLQVRGYAQLDGRFFEGDDQGVSLNTFVLRRVRPIFAGTVAQHFDFYIMPDFGVGTTVTQDAYLDVRYTPGSACAWASSSLRRLERLQSARSSRSSAGLPHGHVPTATSASSSTGAGGRVFAYAAGVFDGAPDRAAWTST